MEYNAAWESTSEQKLLMHQSRRQALLNEARNELTGQEESQYDSDNSNEGEKRGKIEEPVKADKQVCCSNP